MKLRYKKFSLSAKPPVKAHKGDLGYDLFCNEVISIFPNETKKVKTGIGLQFPEGWGGIVKDRSSVATNRELFVCAGVIDNGYVGEIQVPFHNGGEHIQSFMPGDKIAQLIPTQVVTFDEIEEAAELESTDQRGAGGFGSTGA